MTTKFVATEQELQIIPGVGPSIAQDLRDLGISKVSELRGRDAEEMFTALCALRGSKIDRCVLYVFRCAVYYATHEPHDPNLLKWWNWKNGQIDS
jgi:predicted RecB family nuclease